MKLRRWSQQWQWTIEQNISLKKDGWFNFPIPINQASVCMLNVDTDGDVEVNYDDDEIHPMTQIISLWSIASHYFYPAAAAFFSAMGSVWWVSILQVLLLPGSILLPISAGNRCPYNPPPFFMLIYHLPTSWLCTSKCLSRPSAYYCFIGNTFTNIICFYV